MRDRRVIGAGSAGLSVAAGAVQFGLKAVLIALRDITGMIAPYPTLGEISKRAAGAWFAPTLFSNRIRILVRLLHVLPV